ncbi:uncharacterized protein LOC34619768 [Cyclospora cayetanensis]|uniref:Uncharacterized protein LOC34619768 n=1 Tax=Cyclospora cayetanensis TaxID=88456 RepID=A0A6P6RXG0_9EIME|nr:uncharacterized protein LOC34619768 [Cyclospora cayetanensis]
MVDVYGLESEKAGMGGAFAPDSLLRTGAKVMLSEKDLRTRKAFDFKGMQTMQVLDPSLLGRSLLQRIRPLQITDCGSRTANLIPLPFPALSHASRQQLILSDSQMEGPKEATEGAIDSLMYLPTCNDTTILDSLQQRFVRGHFFTSCDNMLIFVNPWEAQRCAANEIFSHSKAVQYWTNHIAELPSHPYLVARRAFSNAKKQHRNQLVLTFGASGCGQDRVHHELVKLFVRFAFTMEDVWTDEEARTAEAARDAAVSLVEALHISHRGDLYGGRLMDLFQVEFDADGDVVGFKFLPNSSSEPSQEIISWQMRQSLKSIPLPSLFYHLMYAIHFNPDDPMLKNSGLHPVDVTELMRYFPPPSVLYEDTHYEKCKQLIRDLGSIGLSKKQITECLRLVNAILVADVASYKIQNETSKENEVQAREQERATPTAPRVCRILKKEERKVEQTLVLANLLGVDETVLRDIFLGADSWQIRFLALKLFVRLRWWLLGMISQTLRLSKGTSVHSRITLLKAAGIDFRHIGQEWALNQLLHNYTEEYFLYLFSTSAFTLDQATYLLEDVKPPPTTFILNDKVLDVFAGPEGIWQILREEQASWGGEAANELSQNVPLAALAFVDRILRIKSDSDKIRKVPGYRPPSADVFKPKIAFRVVKAAGKNNGPTVLGKNPQQGTSAPQQTDPVQCQFIVVHTHGSVMYDATKFCISDANAYTVPSRLRNLLLASKLELVRSLVYSEAAQDVIPPDCSRVSFADRLIQYVKDSLSEGTASLHAPAAAPLRLFSNVPPIAFGVSEKGQNSNFHLDRWRQTAQRDHDFEETDQQGMQKELARGLVHEPLVPSRIVALMENETKQANRASSGLPSTSAPYKSEPERFFPFGVACPCVVFRRRIDYLERLVPAVTRMQRMWRTVRERAFVADMRWLCIRVQSHIRRIRLLQELAKLKSTKDFFFGAVILAGFAYAFRRLGLSDEVVRSIEMNWRERRKFQELRGLTMAFLSIQRKGEKLYSMRVMLNYRPIIRRTTVMRDMILFQMDPSVVRIQSFFRMAVIRQQYLRLRNAALLCQAGILTRLRRGDFLLTKRRVVKLQRWWRSMRLLRGMDIEVGLPPPVRLPGKADSVVRRRELVAFELLRPHFLMVQGMLRFERTRQDAHCAYPFRLHANSDCRGIYPRTWALPLQDLLTQLAAKARHQQHSYISEAMQVAAVTVRLSSLEVGAHAQFQDIAIGGHHSLVLLGVRQAASGNFATRVRMVVKGGGWQDFSLEPRVYAWGWSDKGQLGAPQRPGEQGMSCIGPLKFIDRVFKDSVDPATGHLVQNLIHEVDYTHTVCTVAAGLDHSVALTSEGMVFAWGDNSEGQCGLGHRLLAVRHPTLIPTIRNNGIKLKSIAAGPRQTGAVSMDGKALMWGAAHFVRLPTVVPDSHSYTPRGVPLDAKYEALQICCSSGFNILRTAGTSGVLGWGRNESGQLGQGPEDKKSRDLPIFIPLPATPAHSHVVSKVVVGTSFVVVSLQQASSFLYTWGALYVEEASEAAASGAGGVAGAKRSPGAQGQKATLNPFLRRTGATAAQQQPQQAKSKAGSSKAAEVKAVCKPTRVEHPLWKDDAVIDISATGSEVLTTTNVYSVSPRHRKRRFAVFQLGEGGASIEVPPKIKEKAQKKHKELMDDSARLLSSPLLSREVFPVGARISGSPPSHMPDCFCNQSRQSAKPAAETLVPDARLLHRMRSIYGTGSAKGRLGAFGYDYENDES